MRLGDLDALKADLIHDYAYAAASMVDKQPTIDAVPVVRCKDCDKSQNSSLMGEGWRFCMNNSQHHKEDHYCSYGERKDGDG